MSSTENKTILFVNKLFNKIEDYWESETFQKISAEFLIFTFIISLVFIEIRNLGWISWDIIPGNLFIAINLSFSLLLYFEVISLVFSLVKSVSSSMETQLQILSLIFLRDAFKVFGHISDVYTWKLIEQKLLFIFADSLGALIIFIIIIFIRKYDLHKSICKSIDLQKSFIVIKKTLALILLITFISLILLDIAYFFANKELFNFFHVFFTILIFNDILLVLITLRYSNSYRIIFRNFGYALATILMRVAIELDHIHNVILGISSAVFVLLLVLTYNNIPLPKKKYINTRLEN